MIDVKPLFTAAKAEGDAMIVDRIIVRLLPQLHSAGLRLSAKSVEAMSEILVSQEIFQLIEQTASELLAADNSEYSCRV